LSFDESSWNTGDTGIGYGDEDDNTIISTTISLYIRSTFNIIELSDIEQVLLHMDYDDGFVAYLNGTEIARAFMAGNPPTYNQTSNDYHEANLYQGFNPEQFFIEPTLLNQGSNILAIQVHNQDINSSDLSALPVLSLGINNSSTNYSAVPDWFETPFDFTSSNLPLVIIDTQGGQTIPDEPKIFADMQIVYRGEGQRTLLNDKDNQEFIDFDSKIMIEVRGASSQSLPKKQYGFTTYNEDGSDKDNVKLLGMPKENDWILNGLAYDPSLMRDYIAYNLSRRIGEYASRTQYCEVVLNGSYLGLYILQEKMKKDGDRINITPVGDNQDGNITGGYITKSDKTNESDPSAWSMPNYSGWFTEFIHTEPKPEEVTSQQNGYIQGVFEALQSTSASSNTSKTNGYPSIIDIPSFLNFMIMNELAGNVDGYQFSTYFHKDKNGKLRAGPIWDFNLTLGNDLFDFEFDRSHTDIWQLENGNVGAKFWKDLFDDSDYRCYLSKRWNELTAAGQPLHKDNIFTLIDETALLIAEAKEREQQTWGTVSNHESDIANMKVWITERMNWINSQIGSFAACSNVAVPSLVISKINYNPFSEQFGDSDDQEFIEISNTGTSSVDLTGIYFGGTGFVYQFSANASLAGGESIVLARDSDTYRARYGESPYDEFTRELSNKEQQLILLDAFGNIIDEVLYQDKSPWPEQADGDGYYLQLSDLDSDNNDPLNWTALLDESREAITNIDPTGISQIKVYPNPSENVFMIQSTGIIRSIRLYDLQGQLLLKEMVNDLSHQIDLSQYDKSTYILKIDSKGGYKIQRLMKM